MRNLASSLLSFLWSCGWFLRHFRYPGLQQYRWQRRSLEIRALGIYTGKNNGSAEFSLGCWDWDAELHHWYPDTVTWSPENSGKILQNHFYLEAIYLFLAFKDLPMQYLPVGLCTFRGNRMREFFTRHCALPSPLMCSPESKLECNIVALNFSLHIKVPYGQSLPSVIFALYQSLYQCLHLYCLTILKKRKKKEFIFCSCALL